MAGDPEADGVAGLRDLEAAVQAGETNEKPILFGGDPDALGLEDRVRAEHATAPRRWCMRQDDLIVALERLPVERVETTPACAHAAIGEKIAHLAARESEHRDVLGLVRGAAHERKLAPIGR